MSKDINHHGRRLLARMVQAETATDRSEAQRILKKADKHRRKLSRLRQLVRKLFGGT
jgi:hypothetical protein